MRHFKFCVGNGDWIKNTKMRAEFLLRSDLGRYLESRVSNLESRILNLEIGAGWKRLVVPRDEKAMIQGGLDEMHLPGKGLGPTVLT